MYSFRSVVETMQSLLDCDSGTCNVVDNTRTNMIGKSIPDAKQMQRHIFHANPCVASMFVEKMMKIDQGHVCGHFVHLFKRKRAKERGGLGPFPVHDELSLCSEREGYDSYQRYELISKAGSGAAEIVIQGHRIWLVYLIDDGGDVAIHYQCPTNKKKSETQAS